MTLGPPPLVVLWGGDPWLASIGPDSMGEEFSGIVRYLITACTIAQAVPPRIDISVAAIVAPVAYDPLESFNHGIEKIILIPTFSANLAASSLIAAAVAYMTMRGAGRTNERRCFGVGAVLILRLRNSHHGNECLAKSRRISI